MNEQTSGLSAYRLSVLRTADRIELDAFEHGWLTPSVETALAELRQAAWVVGGSPYIVLNAVTAVYDAIHAEEARSNE